jgi:hypothetical protein
MMFQEIFAGDERSHAVNGMVAQVFLGLTQILLAGIVFYRLYVVGQPDSEINDLRLLLAFSIFGYIAARLYFGGILPELSWGAALTAYAGLAGLITVVCLLIYGWPAPQDWAVTWLPAFLGPAILVGMYALVAYLGKRRVEREIGE